MEFLVTMTTRVPPGTADETVAQVRQREAAHSLPRPCRAQKPTFVATPSQSW